MRCGGAAFTKGRFKVAAFGALSRFDNSGAFQSSTFKAGKQIGTSGEIEEVTTLPSGDIYYGERPRQSGL